MPRCPQGQARILFRNVSVPGKKSAPVNVARHNQNKNVVTIGRWDWNQKKNGNGDRWGREGNLLSGSGHGGRSRNHVPPAAEEKA